MSTHSLLRPGYCLRGWIGLPHALVCGVDVIRLNRTEFNTLVFCDGHTDLEILPLPKLVEPWYRVPLRCDYRCYIIIKPGREGKVVDSLDIM